jgi:UDP-N-acetylmuramate dehydrogenase
MMEAAMPEWIRPAGWRARLVEAFAGDPAAIELDRPLAPKVAFRIGGPADAFVRPKTAEQLALVLRIAREEAVPICVLGTGSNVLVLDGGIRGITLRLAGELADVHIGRATEGKVEIEAGAGALNAPLVALALNMGLVGIEFLATIPGTFGGALIMNAGAHGGELGSYVDSVTLINAALEVESRPGRECGFAYRSSGFRPGEILTGARLVVAKGDASAARAHLRQMRDARKRTQPSDHPNAGSIFKNPPGDFAGRLIEACGLKGRRIGGALISPIHANFIVNERGASAHDVVALANEAERAVKERFGIDLEWEVRRLGDQGVDRGTDPSI